LDREGHKTVLLDSLKPQTNVTEFRTIVWR